MNSPNSFSMSGRMVVYIRRLSAIVLLFFIVSPTTASAGEHDNMSGATFNWTGAVTQSFYFLGIEHAQRLTQKKTRDELKGPFFPDWKESVAGLHGWSDGGSFFTNYIAHPMQGGVSGFIQIQNDAHGRSLEFSGSRTYWNSRMRALGWAAIYSTQFELGAISEATIGNVGKKPGTAAYVDLVVTPTGGLGMIVLEDVLDKYLLKKLEQRTVGIGKRRLYRVLFNPQRSVANFLRGKAPWHRDSRPIS
jgi:hypothetical protein